jgi:hypothetical protein
MTKSALVHEARILQTFVGLTFACLLLARLLFGGL